MSDLSSLHKIVPQVLRLYNSYSICYRNVHLLHQGPHVPAVVPDDELLRAGRQPGGQYAVAVPLVHFSCFH